MSASLKINPALTKKLIITLLALSVHRLGLQVPLPFIDSQGLNQLGLGLLGIEKFSIFRLGIMPYISAYVFIEILSLFIPPLKKLRSGDANGRKKLKIISLILAIGLAVFQAKLIVDGLAGLNLPGGGYALNITGNLEYLMIMAVIVCCFYFLVALCELISKFGIGHGISLIILSDICAEFYDQIPDILNQQKLHGLSPLIIAAIVFFVLISLTQILLKTKLSVPCCHNKDNIVVDYFKLNMSPSALSPVIYAVSLIMVPATLAQFLDNFKDISEKIQPGTPLYYLAMVFFIFIFSYLFGWAFLHPRKRVEKMRKRGWHFKTIETSSENVIFKKFLIYNLPWTAFLCLLAILPIFILSKTDVPFYIGGSSVLIVVAIVLDLISGFKFYQKKFRKPVKIAELHDIYDADMIQNHLRAAGIESHMKGFHHRILLYFFGPYLEITLMVDTENQKDAKALINNYYNGLGLC